MHRSTGRRSRYTQGSVYRRVGRRRRSQSCSGTTGVSSSGPLILEEWTGKHGRLGGVLCVHSLP